MKEFKDKAHNLYAVQRKRESIQNTVSKALPILLNEKIRIFTAGINGNVSELCKLLVVSRKNPSELMLREPKTKMTV